ncbi:hypothetical protein GIB67_042089 [Kingdonia uniflora]|uniref:Uncharacterized protein n=1 Tax=Kingdonia uniflora TaxID=39325 RepID=A0A7J7MWD1_9MAGN|nr:hypothetical protein GIB67_042089 [Kingdonia uniflora]
MVNRFFVCLALSKFARRTIAGLEMNTTNMTVRILCLGKSLKPRTIKNHTSLVLNIFGIL